MRINDLRYVCPTCGSLLHGDWLKAAAVPYSVVFCNGCGEWSMRDGKSAGGLRHMTVEEYMRIGFEPSMREVRAMWVKAQK
jgi:hypothetical protein